MRSGAALRAALAHISAAIATGTTLASQRAMAVWSVWTARNLSPSISSQINRRILFPLAKRRRPSVCARCSTEGGQPLGADTADDSTLICSKSENRSPCRDDPSMVARHVFSTCHDCPISWNRLSRTLFLSDAVLPTVFSSRTGAACNGKEVHDASFDAICRCHLANCDGIFLHPCSERSGPIAFARSLPAAAKYPGPKTRRGSSRHQARGWPQAGLSTADSRGRPRRSGAALE